MDNIQPQRARPEIEWSVSVSESATATDRFVIYGLEQDEVVDFLEAHGVAANVAFEALLGDFGRPVQVAVGRDGERTKLYWFLPSREPYFVGADFVDGTPLPRKIYSEIHVGELSDEAAQLHRKVKPHMEWLLDRPECEPVNLFHGVAFRRSENGPVDGMHIGLKPNWRGLLAGDRSLLRRELVHDLMVRLGFEHHWREVERHAFESPMAWTCYISLQVRPTGELGMTVYSRASPVVTLESGTALVEPGEGGTFPRPAVITCAHSELQNLSLRFRFQGPERSFVQRNGWFVDYGPARGDHRVLSAEALSLVETIAHQACGQAKPTEPVRMLEVLESMDGIYNVEVGPDLRREN